MAPEDYMRIAINEALKGEGWTNPNPMVGAVIVKDGRILSKDYHHKCGEYHAERNAILNCGEDMRGAEIYVTLEPCCHYGKTPPCTEIIIQSGIRKVYVGSMDKNPLVAGKGVEMLKAHGIEVVTGVLEEECRAINQVFFHYMDNKTPYVVMKYAMTADGKIATKTGASKWITGEKARARVQEMRHCYMGIIAGIGTVLADDPMLNVRLEGKKSPIRIICDSRLRIPLDSKICRSAGQYRTMIACGKIEDGDLGIEKKKEQDADCKEMVRKAEKLRAMGIEVVSLPDVQGRVDLLQLMNYLGSQKIDSVFLEGGGELNDSFLRAGLVQELKVFIAPKIFGGKEAKTPVSGVGVELPDQGTAFVLEKTSVIGEDFLLEYRAE